MALRLVTLFFALLTTTQYSSPLSPVDVAASVWLDPVAPVRAASAPAWRFHH